MKKQDAEPAEPIKAVEMVRRIRDAHYERFKDRPVEERIACYKEQARAFEHRAGCVTKSGSEEAV